ncbi:MAG: hypothetical protein A2847_00850 [Candidatus Sungbacteria bacterium RIFCSPHIGHO2_01_FULL_50_25]|uniref:PDZ domain-containing protein n=1 Tax=Candidatus Sungbacteria bacterium RIFCSPHIGHO2_01_FULL_50_25 TaxID=1802265 RepID=A0A1G2KB63_9BACT|nr:MAG: hypothetical protein A2847_00850 [Candidatus Sungbacteria bacterium RIFCSPHIGHO2_01_FULL_50_25]
MTFFFILFVIFLISLLILAHEWGHFYSARALGVKVEEFGFGFPPRVFSKMKNGVRYSFNLLPFGGFVRIFGEHGEEEMSRESFASRAPWQRFIILGAGVFMNAVLAWVLFSVSAGIGVPQVVEGGDGEVPVSILSVAPGSPAESAGVKFGDRIFSLSEGSDVIRVVSGEDVSEFIGSRKGKIVTLTVIRGEETKVFSLLARENPPAGEGSLGISMGYLDVRVVPWYQAPYEGAKTLGRSIWATLYGFWYLISELLRGRTSVPVSGPIGIFAFANDIRPLGVSFFLHFMGILSVNLAILNFLPIPALDGGRVAFLIFEKIRGKRINPAFENYAHFAGFAILILLMVLVTYRDIQTFF